MKLKQYELSLTEGINFLKNDINRIKNTLIGTDTADTPETAPTVTEKSTTEPFHTQFLKNTIDTLKSVATTAYETVLTVSEPASDTAPAPLPELPPLFDLSRGLISIICDIENILETIRAKLIRNEPTESHVIEITGLYALDCENTLKQIEACLSISSEIIEYLCAPNEPK